MNSNWIKVYSTENPHRAEIIKQALIENEIAAVVMNKQDSSYISFGILSILVHPDNVDKAIEYLSQNYSE